MPYCHNGRFIAGLRANSILIARMERRHPAVPMWSLPSCHHRGEFIMKRFVIAALGAIILSIVGAGTGLAQVKRVEMKIDGYLCGN